MTTDEVATLQDKITTLAQEVGLRVVRVSEHVVDCRSEQDTDSYSFVLKPLGRGHLDIVLTEILEDDDRSWSAISRGCARANRKCTGVLTLPENGSQVSVITEVPMSKVALLTVGKLHGHLAKLHKAAAEFFRGLDEPPEAEAVASKAGASRVKH